MTVNVGEYGLALNVNVNFDITAATGLSLSFTRPDNSAFSGACTVGQVDLAVPGEGTYLAGRYARYLIQPGDLTVPGEYTVRLTYTDAAPKRLISDNTSFTVAP